MTSIALAGYNSDRFYADTHILDDFAGTIKQSMPESLSTRAQAPLTVSQLNRLAKQTLEDCFERVQVTGELSNVAMPGSGHWYFTLKDDRAQIRCAMFRGRNRLCRLKPEAGAQVVATGKVSLYEGRGDYQLIVDALEPAGDGALAAAFERLKQELQAEGLFATERKKALPPKINHLAVVTSATGAALQDVLSVLRRRWPLLRVSVINSPVQGNEAPAALCAGVKNANRWADAIGIDALLITRGGGSLEDLWAFNDRALAYTIADSELPVVSAVGHEVDFSITDFVADVRAPTPSAAAELLSRNQDDIRQSLQHSSRRLALAYQQRLLRQRQSLNALRARIRHPGQSLREKMQTVDDREMRLRRAMRQQLISVRSRQADLQQRLFRQNPARSLPNKQSQLDQLKQSMIRSQNNLLSRQRQRLSASQQLLNSLSYQQTLNRGYAIVRDENGTILRDAIDLKKGQVLQTELSAARLTTTLIEAKAKEDSD